MKKFLYLIFTLLVLGIIFFVIIKTEASNSVSLQIDYGSPSATLPLDRYARHKFKVKNTSNQTKIFSFSIFVKETNQDVVGWPQPQMFTLNAGEERYVQTFLDTAWGKLDKSQYGSQDRTVRWEFSDLNTGEKQTDEITYKITSLRDEEISGEMKIKGKVVDSSNKAVSEIQVILSTGSGGWSTLTQTDSQGDFSFKELPERNDWFLQAGGTFQSSSTGSPSDQSNQPASSSNQSTTSSSTPSSSSQAPSNQPSSDQPSTNQTVCDPPPAPCNSSSGETKGTSTEKSSEKGVAYVAVDPKISEYTLKLQEPLAEASFKVIKEEKTDIGFWKGAIDKDEKYLLLINGMENWSNSDLKSQSKLYLYTLDGELKWTYDMGHEGWGADLSQDGQYAAFVTSNQTKNFGVIKVASGQPVWVKNSNDFREDNGNPLDSKEIRISPSSEYLAIGSSGGNVYLLKLEKGEVLWNQKTQGQVRAIVFDQNNQYVYAGSGDGNAYKLKIADGSIVWKTDIGSWPFGDGALKLSKDGKYLGSASKAGEATIIATDSGKQLWQADGLGASTWSDFSPDGKYFYAGGGGQNCNVLYETTTGKKLWRVNTMSHQGMFSADGKYLIVGDKDVVVYDLSGNELTTVSFTQGNSRADQGQFAYLSKDNSKLIFTHRDMESGAVSAVFAQGTIKALEQAGVGGTEDSKLTESLLKVEEALSDATKNLSPSNKKWLIYGFSGLGLIGLGVLVFIFIKKRKIK